MAMERKVLLPQYPVSYSCRKERGDVRDVESKGEEGKEAT